MNGWPLGPETKIPKHVDSYRLAPDSPVYSLAARAEIPSRDRESNPVQSVSIRIVKHYVYVYDARSGCLIRVGSFSRQCDLFCAVATLKIPIQECLVNS